MNAKNYGIDNTRFAVRVALVGMLIACSAILVLSLGSVAWITVAHPDYHTTQHLAQPMHTQFTIACWTATASAVIGVIDTVLLRILSHNGYIHDC